MTAQRYDGEGHANTWLGVVHFEVPAPHLVHLILYVGSHHVWVVPSSSSSFSPTYASYLVFVWHLHAFFAANVGTMTL